MGLPGWTTILGTFRSCNFPCPSTADRPRSDQRASRALSQQRKPIFQVGQFDAFAAPWEEGSCYRVIGSNFM